MYLSAGSPVTFHQPGSVLHERVVITSDDGVMPDDTECEDVTVMEEQPPEERDVVAEWLADSALWRGLGQVVVFVLFPIAAVIAFAVYAIAFRVFRVNYRSLFALAAITAGVIWGGAYILGVNVLALNMTWLAQLRSESGDIDVSASIIAMLPLSVPLGVFAAAVLAWQSWRTRDDHSSFHMRETLRASKRRLHQQHTVAQHNNPLPAGQTLGLTHDGTVVVQSPAEAAAHTLLTGASGSGKTTAAMLGYRDIIAQGCGLVVIDAKGSVNVPDMLASFCHDAGVPFDHWLFQPTNAEYVGPSTFGPGFFDPLNRGDATRRKDFLVNAQTWDADYYRSVVDHYLQLAFNVDTLFHTTSTEPAFSRTAELLRPEVLREYAERPDLAHTWNTVPHGPQTRDIITKMVMSMSPQDLSAVGNMRNRLLTIMSGVAGPWMQANPHGRTIDLRRTAAEGGVVVFSLDSANYSELTRIIGTLIIQDLMTLSGELRHHGSPQPLHVFIDEFHALGTESVLGVLNKCRDANMPFQVATQTLSDLARINTDFLNQIAGVIGAFKVMSTNLETDARYFAGVSGMRQIFTTSGAPTRSSDSMFSLNNAPDVTPQEWREEPLIPASQFLELGQGDMIYITKTPQRRSERLTVVPPEWSAVQNRWCNRSEKQITTDPLPISNDTTTDTPANPHHSSNALFS